MGRQNLLQFTVAEQEVNNDVVDSSGNTSYVNASIYSANLPSNQAFDGLMKLTSGRKHSGNKMETVSICQSMIYDYDIYRYDY